MGLPKIRTILIDDCKITCAAFGGFLRKDPEIELVATAFGGREGVFKIRQLKPDVIVTDMDMPGFDGLTVVQTIMQEMPTPIILMSGLDKEHPKVYEALNSGALEFLRKEEVASTRHQSHPRLNALIKTASGVSMKKLGDGKIKKNTNVHSFDSKSRYSIIAIGASTGGPSAIEGVLNALPANLNIPVVIAQHMPEQFLMTFAQRLNKISPLRVKIAERGEVLREQTVYIIPGNTNTHIVQKADTKQPVFRFTGQRYSAFNDPSIDGLFMSMAEVYGEKAIGVVLTGMGKDGTEGLRAIQLQQGYTIAQDESSSVVFGMPKHAIDSGVVQQVLRLRDIPGFLVSCLS